MSEGVSEVSGASERANGRASGPVLPSVFLAVIDHSVLVKMDFYQIYGEKGLRANARARHVQHP